MAYDALTPWGGMLLSELTSNLNIKNKTIFFKYLTMVLTFVTYMSYHVTRKVVSVVTPVLKNGSQSEHVDGEYDEKPWSPFDGDDQNTLVAGLDLAFLLAYAIGMFVSGHLAERTDLRYFLTTGMTLRLFISPIQKLLQNNSNTKGARFEPRENKTLEN